jgi:hypothetical protein
MPMTMEERLDHARSALRAYSRAKGDTPAENDTDFMDTDASDLIADLLHLQKHLGFKDAESTVQTAMMHYEAEQNEYAGGGNSALDCFIASADLPQD